MEPGSVIFPGSPDLPSSSPFTSIEFQINSAGPIREELLPLYPPPPPAPVSRQECERQAFQAAEGQRNWLCCTCKSKCMEGGPHRGEKKLGGRQLAACDGPFRSLGTRLLKHGIWRVGTLEWSANLHPGAYVPSV